VSENENNNENECVPVGCFMEIF